MKGFEGWEEGEGLEGFGGCEGLEGFEGPGDVLDSLDCVRLEAGVDGGDCPGLAGDIALLVDWEALAKPLSMSR